MNIRTWVADLLGSKKFRIFALTLAATAVWSGVSLHIAVPDSHAPSAYVAISENGEVISDGIVSVGVERAWAAGETVAQPGMGVAQTSTGTAGASVVNGLLEVVLLIFLPATMLAGWLLSPDWTFGEIFGLRVIIHDLWVLVSNIVYVVFAFLLVAMAFMNIFGMGGEHYAMKKALPRFVTGILIVPFTWFIVSATLSVTNVLTASILRLPADYISKNANGDTEPTFRLPQNCKLSFNKLAKGADAWSETPASWGEKASTEGKFFDCEDPQTDPMTFGEALGKGKGAYGILNLYAFDIFKVGDMKDIDGANLKSISGVADIVLTVGLAGIFMLVFALLMIALVFALFTRAFYLWVIAIFSPLFGLFYYLEGKGKFAEEFKNLSFTSFLSLALVPVYVSAALAFGLVFIKKAADTKINPQNSSFFADLNGSSEATVDKKASMKFVMGGAETSKQMTVSVEGMPIGKKAVDAAWAAGWTASSGVRLASSALGIMILDILAIIVLWMAVMVALKSSEITKQAVDPIAGFGSSIGKLAMNMPKYVPIPLGKDGNGNKRSLSMAGLENVGWSISTAISQAANQSGAKMGSDFGSNLARSLGYVIDERAKLLNNQVARAKSVQNPTDGRTHMENLWANWQIKDVPDLLKAENSQLKTSFIANLEELKRVVPEAQRQKFDEVIKTMKKEGITDVQFGAAYDEIYSMLGGTKGTYDAPSEIKEKLIDGRAGASPAGAQQQQITRFVNVDGGMPSKVEIPNKDPAKPNAGNATISKGETTRDDFRKSLVGYSDAEKDKIMAEIPKGFFKGEDKK